MSSSIDSAEALCALIPSEPRTCLQGASQNQLKEGLHSLTLLLDYTKILSDFGPKLLLGHDSFFLLTRFKTSWFPCPDKGTELILLFEVSFGPKLHQHRHGYGYGGMAIFEK